MKQILRIAIVAALLTIPTGLSSIKIPYKPTYPTCIMQVGDVKYLLLEPRGEVVKNEIQDASQK